VYQFTKQWMQLCNLSKQAPKKSLARQHGCWQIMDSNKEYKDAIEVSVIFHEGQRMFAVPKQPAPEQYTALEQALTRLQKRYGELEAKLAAQPAPDLQGELEATNRQVEILSDALAESRREIAALAAPTVQEPVAWMHTGGHIQGRNPNWEQGIAGGYTRERGWTPLYTTPPAQRQWVGLTDDEAQQIRADCATTPPGLVDVRYGWAIHYARAIEAKLKEKNSITQPAVPLTEQQKQELAENWFAEDWAITKAIGMMYDHERLLGITKGQP
jgi:hypothetical protein